MEPAAFHDALRKKPGGVLRGLVAAVAGGLVATPVAYEVALAVSPNRTSDGHPTMPIGQVAFALLAGAGIAVAAGWWFGRR
jgi:hypothetical protein